LSQYLDSAGALNVCNFIITNLSSCLALFSKRLEEYMLDIWHCALGHQRCVPEKWIQFSKYCMALLHVEQLPAINTIIIPFSSASESMKWQVCQCPILHMEKGHYHLRKILQKWR